MDEKQNVNLYPSRIEQLTAAWPALNKKKWATIGGVVLTMGALVAAGLRKGAPWYLARRQ